MEEGGKLDIEFKFKQSAFRHGVSEAAILHAFTHPRYDGPIEGTDTRYIRLGFDTNGNLLEIRVSPKTPVGFWD